MLVADIQVRHNTIKYRKGFSSIKAFPGCCQAFILSEFTLGRTEKDFLDNFRYNFYYSYGYPSANGEKVQEKFNELTDYFIDLFCSSQLVLAVVNMENQKYMWELLTAIGFEEVSRWKSDHGEYPDALFSNHSGITFGDSFYGAEKTEC